MIGVFANKNIDFDFLWNDILSKCIEINIGLVRSGKRKTARF